jgi:DNA polymerase III alpha subunit
MSPKDIAAMEKDALGLWLTKHPLDAYQYLVADDLVSLKDAGEQTQKAFRATLICVINDIVFRMTQSGKRLAILCVEDMTAESEEIKVWGDEDIQAMKDALVVGAVVRLKGKAGHDKNDRFQFNVRSAERLDVNVVIEEDKEEVEADAQSESAF